MLKIFHILKKEDWKNAKLNGLYSPVSLETDGFIHCAKADQILIVANSFFKSETKLILIKIDPAKLNVEFKIELPTEAIRSKILFPHIYGPLNMML